MWVMLGMLAAFYAVVVAILYVTQQKTAPTFDEYAVGGRRYGPWYVAMSYVNSWWPGSTFIAFFGLAAGAGVFGMYGLAYSSLGVAMMYFMATRAWRWGKRYDLRSQPDLLGKRFDSSAVRVVASVIGIVSLFPWVVLGMQALGTVFELASDGAWSVTTCLLIGLAVIVIRQYWTVRMGMRGLIMTDAFQGTVAYVFAAVVCVILLSGAAGGPVSFAALGDVADEYLLLPGDGDAYGPLYIFALIFTGVVGSLCWPTSFQRIYTASSVRSVKSGTLCTVLISGVFYTLLMLLGIAATGMASVADNPQDGWFAIMSSYGGTWLLGLGITIVFAASMGHIDGSVQVCGLQIANDLVNTEKRPLSDKQLTYVAKTSMIVFMALAGIVAYVTFSMTRLQLLAQISYQGVVQLAVPLFLGIFWRGGNKQGAVAGMVSGFVVAMVLTWIYPDDIRALGSLTGGIVGIVVNLVVYLVAALVIRTDDAEKARVAAMFDAAKTTVRGAAPVPDESLDEQLHDLAAESRERQAPRRGRPDARTARHGGVPRRLRRTVRDRRDPRGRRPPRSRHSRRRTGPGVVAPLVRPTRVADPDRRGGQHVRVRGVRPRRPLRAHRLASGQPTDLGPVRRRVRGAGRGVRRRDPGGRPARRCPVQRRGGELVQRGGFAVLAQPHGQRRLHRQTQR